MGEAEAIRTGESPLLPLAPPINRVIPSASEESPWEERKLEK